MIVTYLSFGVIKPFSIYCDNIGAIFLARNYEGKRTKYLELKYHFIREQVREGLVHVSFVPSTENKADPFTKNVSTALFRKFTDYLR